MPQTETIPPANKNRTVTILNCHRIKFSESLPNHIQQYLGPFFP